jgi:DNA-binding transcriptional ArsR family regulator
LSVRTMEDVASCRGRMRILGILITAKELNVTEISRRASLNHTSALRHLAALKSAGLISEKCFGRIRIFAFNFQDERAMILVDLFNRFPGSRQRPDVESAHRGSAGSTGGGIAESIRS